MAKKKGVMRIVKVGLKDSKVIVNVEEEKNGDVLTTNLTSDQPPLPEFPKTFAELGKYMCGLMEFPDEWKANHKCTSISIGHEEDDRLNAVVTMYVKLNKFNSGITINSPCLREKIQGAPGGGAFMPAKMLDLVNEIIAHAKAYMDGDRSQQVIPGTEPPKEGDED